MIDVVQYTIFISNKTQLFTLNLLEEDGLRVLEQVRRLNRLFVIKEIFSSVATLFIILVSFGEKKISIEFFLSIIKMKMKLYTVIYCLGMYISLNIYVITLVEILLSHNQEVYRDSFVIGHILEVEIFIMISVFKSTEPPPPTSQIVLGIIFVCRRKIIVYDKI